MKEDIIYLLFDNWCNSGHEPEVIEAMKKAIQNPTEDTIFELSSVVEANAFKAGARSCLKMRKAMADSVVVPDLEITLTEKSRSPMREMVSSRASVDSPFPVKRTSGVSFCFRL